MNKVPFGRPKTQVNQELIEACNRWRNKEITAVQDIEESHVKKMIFYKLEKVYKNTLNKVLYNRKKLVKKQAHF